MSVAQLNLAGASPASAALTTSLRPERAWVCRAARVAVLMTSDTAAVALAFTGAYLVWARAVLHQPLELYASLLPLIGVPILFLASAGLYPGFGLGAVETLRRTVESVSLSFLCIAAASFALKAASYYSRVTFVIAWLLALVLIGVLRFISVKFASFCHWWREPAILIGTATQVDQTIVALKETYALGYRLAAVLYTDFSPYAPTLSAPPALRTLEDAARLADLGVGVALIWGGHETDEIVENLRPHFRRTVILRDEKLLPIEHMRLRNLGGVLGLEATNQLLRWHNRAIKRAVDVLGAAVLLVVTAPLTIIAGALVKLADGGPVCFFQRREGLHRSTFHVVKLRTMRVNAEARLLQALVGDDKLSEHWRRHGKLIDDPRIIPGIGWILRRFSIDELPQALNVLAGQMSLVGPRPFPEYHLDMFPLHFRTLRATVRPGLTGMWQVTVRSAGDMSEQMRYDTYYIRNWSLWLDAYILMRTVAAVLCGRGAC
jgi:Undecaprenyl-phosphate galactose phosphotransferase WbaP